MLFNSYIFIFGFLPLSLGLFYAINYWLKSSTAAVLFLVGASLVFYSYWKVEYVPLLLISLTVNYLMGKWLSFTPRKFLLAIAISFNVALLGYYKYFDFLITTVNSVFHSHVSLLNLVLPLAISFYTFQQIAYVIDSYKGETKHYSFAEYALFVTFFPQLIAGPIVQHNEVIPQFHHERFGKFQIETFTRGLFLFFLGLFKKVVVADSLSIWVHKGYAQAGQLDMVDAWITALSYTFQLYFDFSGYVDMAIGLALLFHIRLPFNFDSPYQATNIQEFWRKWHMTLGRFLTQYLYIPLGGNRKGKVRTYVNLFVIFLVSGIWHGAGWTFILWGVCHGLASIVHRMWQTTGIKLNRVLAWSMTFLFIVFTWVLFRASSLSQAKEVLTAMIDWRTLSVSALVDHVYEIVILLALLFVCLCFKNSNTLMEEKRYSWGKATVLAGMTVCALLFLDRVQEFLYYQF